MRRNWLCPVANYEIYCQMLEKKHGRNGLLIPR